MYHVENGNFVRTIGAGRAEPKGALHSAARPFDRMLNGPPRF